MIKKIDQDKITYDFEEELDKLLASLIIVSFFFACFVVWLPLALIVMFN